MKTTIEHKLHLAFESDEALLLGETLKRLIRTKEMVKILDMDQFGLLQDLHQELVEAKFSNNTPDGE